MADNLLPKTNHEEALPSVGMVITAHGSGTRKHKLPDPLGMMTPIKTLPIKLKHCIDDSGKNVFPMVLVMQATNPDGFGVGGFYVRGNRAIAYQVDDRDDQHKESELEHKDADVRAAARRRAQARFDDIARVSPIYVRVFEDHLPGHVPDEFLLTPEEDAITPDEREALAKKQAFAAVEELRVTKANLRQREEQLLAMGTRLDALEKALGGAPASAPDAVPAPVSKAR